MIMTLIRTGILYIFVTVGIRIMGKRQIGDMQPNELVVTLLISEIAALPLQDTTQPVVNGIIAIFMLVILEIVLSIVSMKSFRLRKLMSGSSIVVIKNGQIDQSAMRKVRMTLVDLIELLRGQQVFDISTVAFAVLEVNGSLSVLLKNEKQAVTTGDIQLETPPDALQLPVITDGRIIKESLKALETDRESVEKILSTKGLSIPEVFLMTLDRHYNFNIVERKERHV